MAKSKQPKAALGFSTITERSLLPPVVECGRSTVGHYNVESVLSLRLVASWRRGAGPDNRTLPGSLKDARSKHSMRREGSERGGPRRSRSTVSRVDASVVEACVRRGGPSQLRTGPISKALL